MDLNPFDPSNPTKWINPMGSASLLARPQENKLSTLPQQQKRSVSQPAGNLTLKLTKQENHFGVGGKNFRELSYAVSGAQGCRYTMEDTHVAQLPMKDCENASFVGVFDGHGGPNAARFVEKQLSNSVATSESFQAAVMGATEGLNPTLLAKGIEEGYINCDALLRQSQVNGYHGDKSGSTAVSCLITKENLIFANAGDSRAILVRNSAPFFATEDHKPTLIKEIERIKKAGGYVRFGRVLGDLSMTRAFGDFRYKKKKKLKAPQYIITVVPDIEVIARSAEDQLLILACDGIFDVMENEEVVKVCLEWLKEGKALLEIANLLVDECYARGSKDNMTAMLVKFPSV